MIACHAKPKPRPAGLVALIVYKGILGTIELVIGLFILAVLGIIHGIIGGGLAGIHDLARLLVGLEPEGAFFHQLLNQNSNLPLGAYEFAWFLIGLGAFKWFLAVGLWRRSMLMRNIGLVVLGAAGLFSVYELTHKFGAFKLLALLIDGAIFYYLWRVFPKHVGHY